jgi:hypothetical protein
MSVERTKPGVRVVSEVRLPSPKPSPAIPIARVSRDSVGGRSKTISRSSPWRRSIISGSRPSVAGTTWTPGQRRSTQRNAGARSIRPSWSAAIRAGELREESAVTAAPPSFSVEAIRPGSISAGAESARKSTTSHPGTCVAPRASPKMSGGPSSYREVNTRLPCVMSR